jgi:archaeal cell division control protein 6
MWDETLFRDPDVFEIDYIPDQFNYRENQMRELSFLLKPGIKGGRPLNAVIKGTPGTGKTTSVRKIFSDIDEMESKMVPIQINCQIENTRFSILSEIYKKLAGHTPSAAGNSFKRVYESIAQAMIEQDRVVVVGLDDANYLLVENELNNILYLLLRSHEAYPGTRIGVVVVISDMEVDLSRDIDSRVRSVFAPTEIYFPPYAEIEVYNILRERVLQGLYPGVLSDEMLKLIASHTMASGDLRVGIDMLKRATMNAEMAAEREIGREHIKAAYKISKYIHLQFSIKSLSKEEKDVIRLIARESDSETQLTTGDLFEQYKTELNMGYTTFYQIIQKLDSLRLLNLQYKEGRGRTRLLNLRYDPDKILLYL